MKNLFFIFLLISPLYSIKKNQQNKRRSTRSSRHKKTRGAGHRSSSIIMPTIPIQIIYQEIITNMSKALEQGELTRAELESMYTTSQNTLLALSQELHAEQIKKNNIEENQKKLIEYQTMMKTNQDAIYKQLSSEYKTQNKSEITKTDNSEIQVNENNPDKDQNESDNEE